MGRRWNRVIDDATRRFIELLEKDAALARRRADDWAELGKRGARLETSEGKIIATADQMVERFRDQEKELRSIIAKVGPK